MCTLTTLGITQSVSDSQDNIHENGIHSFSIVSYPKLSYWSNLCLSWFYFHFHLCTDFYTLYFLVYVDL